jgi:N6-adenosine-specific RNA methylase IME4
MALQNAGRPATARPVNEPPLSCAEADNAKLALNRLQPQAQREIAARLRRQRHVECLHRLSLRPSAADIADALEPIERAAAKERQLAGKPPGNFPEGGRALDKIAKFAGKDRKTVQKARAVRDAAKAEPEKFGKLQVDMDRTGRVDGPFKRLKVIRQSEAIRKEPPPLPQRGPYEQICALGVRGIAHQDCLLWLWTTNRHMREAFTVLDAWEFDHKTILTWVKDCIGKGDWLRGQSEHCLMAVRGKPIVELTNQTTLLHGRRRGNSQKPVEFYDFIEKLCPAPRYAYLFSRYRHNEKWDCHGDEAPPAQADAAE